MDIPEGGSMIKRPIYCRRCSTDELEPVIAYKVAVPRDADVPDSREEAPGDFYHTDGSECRSCGEPVDPLEAPNLQEIHELIEEQKKANKARREASIERERQGEASGRVDSYLKDS